jgi:trehalose-6-phosphate synthase
MRFCNFEAPVEENRSGKSIIIVSNRESCQHKKIYSTIKVEKSGGLKSSMYKISGVTGDTWLPWRSGSEDRGCVDNESRRTRAFSYH